MNKTSVFLLLSALCAQAVLAVTCLEIRDNTGLRAARLCAATDKNGPSSRICYCVKNTQTGSISTYKDNNARFFSSSDCTGNFQAVKDASLIEKTQWVNSVSVALNLEDFTSESNGTQRKLLTSPQKSSPRYQMELILKFYIMHSE
ncbi:MAG: hypothetical protein JOS17DRAFT_795898 [Linnemannia elongata]|nr:MAG: hypothetical protein JOS17DRAFT_795898 [Linnemannia elongata]